MAVQLTAAEADGLEAAIGKALFERRWVAAPASTDAANGLGPLFNARSCAACHRDGGGAHFEVHHGDLQVHGLVVRTASLDGSPHPVLGRQIQDHSLPGMAAEGRVEPSAIGGRLTVSTTLVTTPDPAAVLEVRVAPSLRGKALLDQVDEAAILARADPDDLDGDGISGRPSMMRDSTGVSRLGRYGSKATGWSLLQQTAEAAALDIGLSSPLVRHPYGDCTARQTDCLRHTTGQSEIANGEEISLDVIRLIATYLETLDAPKFDPDPAGLRQFTAMGCATCHVPTMPSASGKPLQVFSDVLLHDLGEPLRSAIGEGNAEPAEWRTAPLRDLDPSGGLRRYLHDGRAATLTEAIAHHGGEAAAARHAFDNSDGRAQRLLIDFLSKL